MQVGAQQHHIAGAARQHMQQRDRVVGKRRFKPAVVGVEVALVSMDA